MILGAAVALAIGATNANPAWVIFPLVAVGLGIISSLIGLAVVRKSGVREPGQAGGRDPGDIAMGQLNKGYYVTAVLRRHWHLRRCLLPARSAEPQLVGLRGLRPGRHRQQHRLRLHHAVLHLRHVPPGARDRGGQQDWTGDDDHLRPGGRLREYRAAGAGHLRLARSRLLPWHARRPGSHGVVSIGGIYGTAVATHGHADERRLHPGDGHLRPDHRQRRWHRRDERRAGVRTQHHRRARRRRQHDQGADQGLRHRLGGAGGLPALQRLPGHHFAAHHGKGGRNPLRRQPGEPADLHRRADRRDADLPLQLARHSRRRHRRAGHDRGGAPPVQGQPRIMAGHLPSRTTPAAWISARARRCARWLYPACLVVLHAHPGRRDPRARRPRRAC